MIQVIRLLTIISILFINSLKANDEIKNIKPNSLDEIKKLNLNLGFFWKKSNTNNKAAMLIGYAYLKDVKDYENALQWFEYSDKIKSSGENSYLICKTLVLLKKKYEAIDWCKKAISLNYNQSLFELAHIYTLFKNYNEAELLYKKAIKKDIENSYFQIAKFYSKILTNDVLASAYMISIIDKKLNKKDVLNILQLNWHISNKDILKGYKVQLNSLDFKYKYKKKLELIAQKPTSLKEVVSLNYKLKSLWENAQKDPKAAITIAYAYKKYKKDYKKAIYWYKYSDAIKPLPKTSTYICYCYQKLKEYDRALRWCKKAKKQGSKEALFQLGTTYFYLGEYENSLKYFLKSSKIGKTSELNLGFVYSKLKNYKESEKWYKKAIKNNKREAYKHISYFYHDDLKNDIKATAYFIATINTIYDKKSVLNLLQNNWKISNETIKKGYKLQLNSDEFPIKFKGNLGL
ncbi:tetratricopeptide repeat protein [Arcobacter sp. CECT 8985]|uniref:tetratricopeptide repeat protein n=1 Tax=Arcobacter sp. CECT 8985 TaxID=1935424 RepID=UPI00100BF18C|nr:tetratricopeptide repeat protein [Arcobacter sp. CECT 8985]RXJ87744.1 hypothetical protein CRU93_02825 [Arcobacter sp. CECT 8985]